MSTVAAVSLAIIAATCIIAVGAFIVFLVFLRRVVSRADAILALVQRALPGLVTDSRAILTKVDREILGEVVHTVHQVTAVVGSGVSTLEQVQSSARRVTKDVILPQIGTALGLWAAIREGLTWFRPGGDGKRR